MGKKPKVTPVITGFRGIKPIKKELKRLELHYHPQAIKGILEDFVKESEDEKMKILFQDCLTLVDFALSKVKIEEPQDKEKHDAE